MSHSQPHPGEPGYDPNDPHGFHSGDDHGHHVSSMRLLVTILGLLLFLTFLTVATAQAEVWVMDFWGISIPTWVNVVVAMSIATVKGLLVCAYFMHLKHDSAINTYAMLYCLLAMALFLFFVMLDLGNRDRVYEFKQDAIIAGGTGEGVFPGRMSITEFSREKLISEIGEEKYNKKLAEKHAGYHGHGGGTDPEWSTASRHIKRTGLSGALSLDEPKDDHGYGHAEDHANESDHADDHEGDGDPSSADEPAADPAADPTADPAEG